MARILHKTKMIGLPRYLALEEVDLKGIMDWMLVTMGEVVFLLKIIDDLEVLTACLDQLQ